jgi:hypothetical protein
VLFKSVVRCLLSTGEPALRSLHDIWSTPVAFLIFILLTSLAIVSVFIGLKSKSMLFFGAFFSDTVYARVVVFIKDNSFTNIICNIYKKKELKVSHTK